MFEHGEAVEKKEGNQTCLAIKGKRHSLPALRLALARHSPASWQDEVNFILVARSEERLQRLSDELSRHYGIKADVIATNLSRLDAAKRVKAAVQERALTVDMLVNNAGFAIYDHFEKIDPERDHQQVMVNVTPWLTWHTPFCRTWWCVAREQ